MTFPFQTVTEQVAAALRDELLRGRWGGSIPGRNILAEALGVNRKTVDAALRILEGEGILVNRGPRRRREVVLPKGAAVPMRVAILHYDPASLKIPLHIELAHQLEEAGHTVFAAAQTLADLQMELRGVQRFVGRTDADAWIVCAGSQEVLTWFADQPFPSFALFGRRQGLAIASAGPDMPAAVDVVTRRLLKLGHKRIVNLCMSERRHPAPGKPEQAFLDALRDHGIQTGPYNLPDWEPSPEGLQTILQSLFELTPPTALISGSPILLAPVMQFLARRKLQVPEDVSLISTDHHPEVSWCVPSIAHVSWDHTPVIHRVVRWASNVSRGRTDLCQSFFSAKFVEGGTIGPPLC